MSISQLLQVGSIRTTLCSRNYRYSTPYGGFGMDRRTDGWHLCRWSQETGTVTFGVFETIADADSAVESYVKGMTQ